jgi:hypothetical protein
MIINTNTGVLLAIGLFAALDGLIGTSRADNLNVPVAADTFITVAVPAAAPGSMREQTAS